MLFIGVLCAATVVSAGLPAAPAQAQSAFNADAEADPINGDSPADFAGDEIPINLPDIAATDVPGESGQAAVERQFEVDEAVELSNIAKSTVHDEIQSEVPPANELVAPLDAEEPLAEEETPGGITTAALTSRRARADSASTNSTCGTVIDPNFNGTIQLTGNVPQSTWNNRNGSYEIRVENTGNADWPAGTYVTYRLYDSGNNLVSSSGLQSAISGGLAAHTYKTLLFAVEAKSPGNWTVLWDVRIPGAGSLSEDHGVCAQGFTMVVPNIAPSLSYQAPANYGSVTTRTPFLTVEGSDPDGWTGTLTYAFVVCSDAALTQNCQSSGSSERSWQTPALEWGSTYYWAASVGDGSATTDGGSLVQRFTVVVPTPDDWRLVGAGLGMANVNNIVLPYGVYVRSFTDAALRGPGLPFEFTRTYSSGASAVEGSIGKGWLTVLDARVVYRGDTLTATYPDGRQELFGKTSAGTWIGRAELGVTNRVTQNANNAFDITQANGETDHYNSAGQLTSVTNTTGEGFTLSRSGGLVTEITQIPSGRTAVLTWTGAVFGTCTNASKPTRPYLQTISVAQDSTTPLQTWRYGYTCSDLTSVTDPSGAKTTFNVGTNAFSATTPEGRLLTGLVSNGTWTNAPGGEYQQRSIVTTVPGSTVNSTIKLLRSIVGKETFYRQTYNDFSGITALYCQTRTIYNGSESCSNVYRTLQFDLVGRLRVDATRENGVDPGSGIERRWFYNQTSGQLEAMKDENGNLLAFTYDANGNPTSSYMFRDPWTQITTSNTYQQVPDAPGQPLRLVGTMAGNPGNVALSEYASMFSYDSVGRLIKRDGPSTPATAVGEQTIYTYTTSATVAFNATYGTVPGQHPPVGLLATETRGTSSTQYLYDEKGNQTGVVGPGSAYVGRTFDSAGNVIIESVNSADTTYERDNLGRPIRTLGACAFNAVTGVSSQLRTDNTYDRDGLLLTTVRRALQCNTSTEVEARRTTTYEYNAAGRLSRTTNEAGGSTSYEYSPANPDQVIRDADARGRVTNYVYSSSGRINYLTADFGAAGSSTVRTVASYQYDVGGRLITDFDALGRETTYSYTGDNLLKSAIRTNVFSNGTTHTVTLYSRTYDSGGLLASETLGGTRRTDYGYDSEGRLRTTTVDPLGVARVHTVNRDTSGQIVGYRDADGGGASLETRYVLNSDGYVVQQSVGVGSNWLVTRMNRDAWGNSVRDYDANGNVTDYSGDALGRIAITTAPAVQTDAPSDTTLWQGLAQTLVRPVTVTGYNAFGEVTEEKDALGRITQMKYDTGGRLIEKILPTMTGIYGSSTQPISYRWTYNDGGDQTSHTVPGGYFSPLSYQYSYDLQGNRVKETGLFVGGQFPITTWSYDAAGQMVASTSPLGVLTQYSYDKLGRKVGETVNARNNPANPSAGTTAYTTTYAFNDVGDLLSVTTPAGRKITHLYNGAGELTQTKYPGINLPDTWQYDFLGRVTLESKSDSTKTRHVYDFAGRETQTIKVGTDNTQIVTAYAYDNNGNVVQKTDPLLHATTYTYDRLNRLLGVTEPISATDTIVTQAGYDAVGNQVRLRDGRGNDTWTQYSSWDLPLRVIEPATAQHPGLSDRTWEYGYNTRSELVTEGRPGGDGTTWYRQDDGQILTEEAYSAASQSTSTRGFRYDAAGRMIEASSAPSTITIAWSDRGQVTATNDTGITSTQSYDADGVSTGSSINGITTSYQLDSAGRATGTTSGAYSGTTTYDPDTGRITKESWQSGTETYAYDPYGRLATIKTVNGNNDVVRNPTYQYDSNDNITQTQLNGTRQYTYDWANRLVLEKQIAGNWNLAPSATTWDKSNNRTSYRYAGYLKSWSYDERNRATSWITSYEDEPWYHETATYAYSAVGNLLLANTETSRVLNYDAFGQLSMDGSTTYSYDALGRLTKRNAVKFGYIGLSSDASLVPDSLQTSTERAIRSPSGDLVATIGAYGTRYVLDDLRKDVYGGSVVSGSGVVGSKVGSVVYSEFGHPYPLTNYSGVTGVNQLTSFGYQGDWTDNATGSVYMHTRWYEPDLGVFLTRDMTQLPYEGAASLNRYAYAAGNPISNVDPDGRMAQLVVAGIAITAAEIVALSIAAAAATIMIGSTATQVIANKKPLAEAVAIGSLTSARYVVSAYYQASNAYNAMVSATESLLLRLYATSNVPMFVPSSGRNLPSPTGTTASPSTTSVAAPVPKPFDPTTVTTTAGYTTQAPTITAGEGSSTGAITGSCGAGGIQSCNLPANNIFNQCTATRSLVSVCRAAEPVAGATNATGNLIAIALAGAQAVQPIPQRPEDEPECQAEPDGSDLPVEPYEVGTYKDLKNRSALNDAIDIHHVPQSRPAGQIIPNYSVKDAPAIALPVHEHQSIPNLRGNYSGSLDELLERDFDNLANKTMAPQSSLEKLRTLIEKTYPNGC